MSFLEYLRRFADRRSDSVNGSNMYFELFIDAVCKIGLQRIRSEFTALTISPVLVNLSGASASRSAHNTNYRELFRAMICEEFRGVKYSHEIGNVQGGVIRNYETDWSSGQRIRLRLIREKMKP